MTMKVQNENETVMRMPQWAATCSSSSGSSRRGSSIRSHKAATMTSLLSQRPNQVRRSVSLPAELRTTTEDATKMTMMKRKLSLFRAARDASSVFDELTLPKLVEHTSQEEMKYRNNISATSKKRGRFGDVLQQLDPVPTAAEVDTIVLPSTKVLEVQERRVQNRYRIPVCSVAAQDDDQDSDLYFDEQAAEENLRGLEFVEEEEEEENDEQYDSDDSSMFGGGLQQDENDNLVGFYF
eukprot:CAMPEP_0194029390 /NCGR_PEP_ID=MMETSP0009_2-20130614/3119_1 /TAXON_ID=210454 /ORGANISM="Grammatophora oceanica, Strain CCMP 410" /LENGTH=237 /DNA_ID=CAMNT_0038669037 /DNA_START=134 /DNA_END=847 /DNA_ORIENTATION=-